MARLVSKWEFTRAEPGDVDSYWSREVGVFTLFVDNQDPGRFRGWVTGEYGDEMTSLKINARTEAGAKARIQRKFALYLRTLANRISP